MDYPIHIDTTSMDLSILYFKVSQIKISKFKYISVPEDLANSADTDEIHLGLHCLPKCLLTGIPDKNEELTYM